MESVRPAVAIYRTHLEIENQIRKLKPKVVEVAIGAEGETVVYRLARGRFSTNARREASKIFSFIEGDFVNRGWNENIYRLVLRSSHTPGLLKSPLEIPIRVALVKKPEIPAWVELAKPLLPLVPSFVASLATLAAEKSKAEAAAKEDVPSPLQQTILRVIDGMPKTKIAEPSSTT